MNNIFTKVSINIVLVFMTIIMFSFIPDEFPSLFGDRLCTTGNSPDYQFCIEGYRYVTNPHAPGKWHWGYRHWLWLFMGIFLFIVQVVRIITLIGDNQNASNKQ